MKKASSSSKAPVAPEVVPSPVTAVSRVTIPGDSLGVNALPSLVIEGDKDIALSATDDRFVLGRTKAGRLNGKVESFGDYCLRMTTSVQHPHGMAASQKHASALEKDHPEWGKLPVVSRKDYDKFSRELDAIRKEYNAVAKPSAIAVLMHSATELSKFRLVKNAKGARVDISAQIVSEKLSAEKQLAAENAALKAELAALKAAQTPAQKRARKVASAPAIDVPAVVPAVGAA